MSTIDYSKSSRSELCAIAKKIITENPSLKSEIGNYTQVKTPILINFIVKHTTKTEEPSTKVVEDNKIQETSTKKVEETPIKVLSIIEIVEKLVLSKTFQISDEDFNEIIHSINVLKAELPRATEDLKAFLKGFNKK